LQKIEKPKNPPGGEPPSPKEIIDTSFSAGIFLYFSCSGCRFFGKDAYGVFLVFVAYKNKTHLKRRKAGKLKGLLYPVAFWNNPELRTSIA